MRACMFCMDIATYIRKAIIMSWATMTIIIIFRRIIMVVAMITRPMLIREGCETTSNTSMPFEQ